MQILSSEISLDRFFDSVGRSSQPLLMLDYDGTLAPFVVDREQAVPYPGILSRLDAIRKTSTRLVIVTGRAITVLKKLLPLDPPPEIWGCHGAEMLAPDGAYSLKTPEHITNGLKSVESLALKLGLADVLEVKPGGCAFHWRGLDNSRKVEIENKTGTIPSLLENASSFVFHRFDGGIEIKAADITKGNAVKEILATHSASDATAYLGDDATDEDAFYALDKKGLRVLVQCKEKQTAADVRITPPEELYSFLDRWIDAAG